MYKTTYYSDQVFAIRAQSMPKEYLCEQMIRAKRFMDACYDDHGIDLDVIAESASYSKFHFVRMFKAIYGRTPNQYLTAVRLEKAKELLRRGRSVTEVCMALGFSSVTSFAGLYKKMTGHSPSHYSRMSKTKVSSATVVPLMQPPGFYKAKYPGKS